MSNIAGPGNTGLNASTNISANQGVINPSLQVTAPPQSAIPSPNMSQLNPELTYGINYNKNYNPAAFSQRRIETVHQLPIEHEKRRITDICCCGLGVLFGIILFILACVLFNKNNLIRANFPSDNQGHLCLYDKNSSGQLLPFVYFSDLNDPLHNRYCVADCPQPDVPTYGWNGTANLGYYPNYPQSDRLGAYCMPQNQAARDKLIQDTGINLFGDALTAIDILLISVGISVFISLVFLLLVHYCTKIAVWLAFGLAIVLLVVTAIVFFVDTRSAMSKAPGWGVILAILALVIAIILIFYLAVHNRRISYCIVFLQNAAQMIKQKCIIVVYIPIFIALTFIFGILIVFQYLAFSSVQSPNFSKDSLYANLTNSFWFMAPLVIETLWGLSFLRDAFNFCVSGCAIQWYFKKDVSIYYPVKALMTKHFGSVAGGSFLNAFLFVPNLFIDLCCNHVDKFCCNCLDLPRGDAYPYIYMTSTSYCPAVRQVQYLCKRSRICLGNESTNIMYSLAARLVIALSTTMIAYWIMEGRQTGGVVNPHVLLGVFCIALFITCYFVDLHVNVAEALMVAFLAQSDVDTYSYRELSIARDSLKNAIDDLDADFLTKDQQKFKH